MRQIIFYPLSILVNLVFLMACVKADNAEDIIRSNDTAKAMIVVNKAGQQKDLALLMCSFTGDNVAVQIGAIRWIKGLDVAAQRVALMKILQQDHLWVDTLVEGEASTSKQIFVNEVKKMASRFSGIAVSTNLFEVAERKSLRLAIASSNN